MALPKRHPFSGVLPYDGKFWDNDAERDAWLADKDLQKQEFEQYRALKRTEELARRATRKTAINKLKANFVTRQILTADEADVYFGE